MPESQPAPPAFQYPPGMMPGAMPAAAPGAAAPASGTGAAGGATGGGGGAQKTPGAALISELDIRSVV